MIHLRYKTWKKIAAGSLAGMIITLGSYAGVQAYSGTIQGRAEWRGYFTNQLDYYGVEVLPAISQGDAIPSYINTPTEFIKLLKDYNASGTTQEKTGSAFIVNTMLGRNGPGNGKTVSVADWTELTIRINDRQAVGKIVWGGTVSSGVNSYYQDTAHDDAFYSKNRSEAGIRFINDDGSTAYEIIRRCANPIGDFSGVQKKKDTPPPIPPSGDVGVCVPMNFKVTVGTDANGNAVPMGVTIKGTPITSTTYPTTTYVYTTSRTVNVTSQYTTGDSYSVVFKETRSYIDYYYNVPIYNKAKPPKITGYVRTAHYAPARSGGSTSMGPCYNYTLTPTLVTNPSGSPAVIEPNASFTATYSVLNSGITKSMSTLWQMTKIIVQPGVSDSAWNSNGSLSSNLTPCGTFFKAAGVSCTSSASASRVFPKNSTTQLGADSLIAEDLAVGTRICYALSVQPYRPYTNAAHTVISTEWRHSKPACLIIGKKPKVQVWGGDLSVGKVFSGASPSTANVQTSISMKSGSQMFGSWVEYGIFARGSVIGTGSGSAFAEPGRTGTLADICGYSRLSFTNYNNDASCSTVGRYISVKSIPNVVASFPGSSSLPAGFSGKPSDLPSGTYSSGSLTLNTSTLAPGKSVILKVAGTVTINGDQTYSPGPYSVAGQLPQLVIIADNIIINDGVKAVDAWLVSKGDLMTCSSVPPLTSITCSEQLTVNGPVMAKRLLLRRTYGSGVGAESGTPAEIFNLRADTYLWATSRAVGNGRVQTVDTNELPPRL